MYFLDAGYLSESLGDFRKTSLSATLAKLGYILVFSNISSAAATLRLAKVFPYKSREPE
jgi:hypothetical protein